MTQQAVERALGKLLTDENFRDRFFANPEIATWEAGFTLSSIELEALSGLSHLVGSSSRPRGAFVRSPCVKAIIATLLVGFSAWKFRGQLS